MLAYFEHNVMSCYFAVVATVGVWMH